MNNASLLQQAPLWFNTGIPRARADKNGNIIVPLSDQLQGQYLSVAVNQAAKVRNQYCPNRESVINFFLEDKSKQPEGIDWSIGDKLIFVNTICAAVENNLTPSIFDPQKKCLRNF